MPPHAFRYAVPEEWYTRHGVRRYGFHGISHRFVSEQAASMLGRQPREFRLVTAHLGNGCSATAVRDGMSVDTTMGLTPLDGLVMGTRSGDVDPGLIGYLAGRTGMNVDEITQALNADSGLQGLSGVGNDMRTVADAAADGNERAQLALDVFVHRLSKAIAALVVGLQRLDALVFTGGIGKTAPSSAAWCSAGWAFSAWLRTPRPMPITAGAPRAASASPARSLRWSYRRTRSS
jgi:acetate kinase